MCVRLRVLHVKVLFALQFWSVATTHVSGQVAACVMTHTTAPECSQFFPTLLNRETLGTQSQVARSRLVAFLFTSGQKSIGTGFNDCVQASLTVCQLHSIGNAPVGVQN